LAIEESKHGKYTLMRLENKLGSNQILFDTAVIKDDIRIDMWMAYINSVT